MIDTPFASLQSTMESEDEIVVSPGARSGSSLPLSDRPVDDNHDKLAEVTKAPSKAALPPKSARTAAATAARVANAKARREAALQKACVAKTAQAQVLAKVKENVKANAKAAPPAKFNTVKEINDDLSGMGLEHIPLKECGGHREIEIKTKSDETKTRGKRETKVASYQSLVVANDRGR
jgi:hypothetical protein